MKKHFRLYFFTLHFLLNAAILRAQPVSGTKTIGIDYLSIADAITDLNTKGVGLTGTTLLVPAGYTETAPSGGYTLGSATLNASLSVSSPLVITNDGGVGSNPLITAFTPGTSTTTDGIFKIAGTDYVTINGIDLAENVLNTTAIQQMEWGYALVKRQATAPFDGCQSVTIKNCTIRLNRLNTASVGIYAGNHIGSDNTALTITAASDANSHNRFTGNTISNVFTGISLNGFNHPTSPYSLYDQNNKIGGDSLIAGNTITNYAGSGNILTAGVYMIYQNNDTVQYNTIDNAAGGGIAHGISTGNNSVLYGICHSTASASNIVVRNNRVKLSKAAGAGEVHGVFSAATGNIVVDSNILRAMTTGSITSRLSMIYLSGNAISEKIRNNVFDSIAVVSTGDMMLMWYSNTTPNIEVTGNAIATLVSKTGGNGLFYASLCDASATGGTAIVRHNNFSNITLTVGANAYIIYHAPRGLQTAVIRDNTIANITATGVTTVYGIHFNGGEGSIIDSNSISNITGAGGLYGIFTPTAITATYSVRNNQVRTFNSSGFPLYGVSLASGSYEFAYNKISDIQSTSATGFVFGVQLTGTLVNTHHNLVGNIRAPFMSNSTAVNGISLGGTAASTHNMFYNTIYLNASSSASLFGSVGLIANAAAALNLRNNIIVNKSVPNGAGLTIAYKRSSAALASYDLLSGNNILYAGVPAAGNLIFNDGTNSDSLLGDFKNRVAPADGNSFTGNIRFIDSTGLTSYFLWPDSTIATVAESGARNIAGYTKDFKGKIRYGNPGYTGTGTNPDIGAIEAELTPVPMVFDSVNVSQIAAAVPVNAVSQTVLKIRINLSGAYNPLVLTGLYFRTSGTTDVNDIDSARVFVTGGETTFNTDEQFGSVVKNPNGSFSVTGNKLLTSGVSYVWLTYNIRAGAALNHIVDAVLDSIILSGSMYLPLNGNPPGSRAIKGPFSGEYFVGSGNDYTSITGIMTDLGILGISGPVTLTLTDSLYTSEMETFPIVVNNIVGSSPVNTITLRPDSAIDVRIVDSVNTSLLVLNGTDYFTIDGRQRATQLSGHISMINNHISAGAAVCALVNDASYNRLTHAVFRGANAPADGAGAVIYFGTGIATGNDYNMIDSSEIGDASSAPSTLIFSAGSADNMAVQNSNNIITGCYLYNFWNQANESNALKLSNGTTDWSITHNHFYQQTDLFGTGSAKQQYVLNLNKGGNANALNNMIITDNYVGGSAPFCGGTAPWSLTLATNKRLTAMHLDLGTVTGSVVKRNTFNHFLWNTTNNSTGGPGIWCAVSYAGGLCNIDSNTIGSMSGTGALTVSSTANATVYGIYISSSTPGIFSVKGNKMGNITVGTSGTAIVNFTGIGTASGAAGVTLNIQGNRIGNDVNDNIKALASASSTAQVVSGINNSGAYVLNIIDNTVRNLTNLYTGTGAGQTAGIISTAGTSQVNGNLVYNLANASAQIGSNAASSVTGISVSSAVAGTVIARNRIYGLNNTHPSAAVQVTGINYAGATGGLVNRNFVHTLSTASSSISAQQTGINVNGGTVRVVNNMIRLGIDSTGLSQPLASVIVGLNKTGGNMAALYNSVSILGQVTGAGLPRTSAFSRTVTGIDSLMNNILSNERFNTGAGGGHYAISLNNTTTLTCNNNLYWVNGNGDSLGYLNNARALTLSAWRTMSSVDGVSGYGNPGFINSAGNAADVDLHVGTITPAEGLGRNIATVEEDYDGQIRSSVTPFDIGADAGNFTPSDIYPPVITYTPLSFTALAIPRTLNVNITDASGLYIAASNKPLLYFKSSAYGFYTHTTGSFVSGTPQNSLWSFTIDPSAIGGLSLGDTLYYFVVSIDSSASSNIGSYPVGADGFSVFSLITYPSAPSYYVLTAPLSGTVKVGAGEIYTSLTGTGGLFEAVNNSVLTGDLTVRIKSNLVETGLNALNMFRENGVGNYAIHIVPDSNIERIVSGAVASADGMLRLNGVRRLIIDGRYNGSGRFLKFANTNVNGPVIGLANDAQKDTIRYCTIMGNCTATGNIVFGVAAVGGTGNDSNMIAHCKFRDTAGIPYTHIYSAGTANAGQENNNNMIADNELSDFSQNAVYLTATGNGDWSFIGNAAYETNVYQGTLCGFRILSGQGHLIRRNSIGGSAADRSGTMMQTATGNVYGFYLNTGSGGSTTIVDSNYFGNISPVFNNNGCYGAYVQAGNVNLVGNVFGGMTYPWDSIRTMYENAIVLIDGGTVLVEGNTIGNVRYTGTGAVRITGVTVTAGNTIIRNNTIRDIYSSSIGLLYTQTVAGIFMNASSGTHIIEGNRIYLIANSNPNTSPLPATGIAINNTAVTSIVRNRIYDIYTLGTGAGNLAGTASGIYVGAGSNTYMHNQVSLGRYVNNENRVTGILDAGTGANKYYYNSILVNGYTDAGVNNSYCLLRNSTSIPDIKNNILFNKRKTGGVGKAFTLGFVLSTGINNTIANYNLMVADTAALAEMPSGTANGAAAWNTVFSSAGTYQTNWSEMADSIPAHLFFTDTVSGDLSVRSANAYCWYVNGKGLPIAGITGDFNTATSVRSAGVLSGPSDIGSVEFSTVTLPPLAKAFAAPVLNGQSSYTFGGRKVAVINWGASGTLPAQLSVRYYSGMNAPILLDGKTQQSAYVDITASGGTGFNYTLSVICDSAVAGNVAGTSSMRLARYEGAWFLLPGSVASAVTGLLSSGSPLTAFGQFTGTDMANPLPVDLVSFRAVKKERTIDITWQTAQEMSSSHYEIERSYDGRSFTRIGRVNASGVAGEPQYYHFEDTWPMPEGSRPLVYYRLKMTDVDGDFTYSMIASVMWNIAETAQYMNVFPNPFEGEITLLVNTKEEIEGGVLLTDMSGKVVMHKNMVLHKGENKLSLETEELKGGVYFYTVMMNGENRMFKVLKP